MVVPSNWPAIGSGKHAAQAAVVLSSIAFATALVATTQMGHTQTRFGPASSLAAPVLRHFGHRSDYYLTFPSIGVATPVTDDLYDDGNRSRPFRASGVDRAYTTRESVDSLRSKFEPEIVQSAVMEPAAPRQIFFEHWAVIYSPGADHLRSVTGGMHAGDAEPIAGFSAASGGSRRPPLRVCARSRMGPILVRFPVVPAQVTLRPGVPENGNFLVLMVRVWR